MPISAEDFEKLPAERPTRAKVPTNELLDFLKEQAYSTKEVAAFLNVQSGTAYSRLKRLKDAGLVEVRFQGATAYWKAVPGAAAEAEEE